MQNNERIMRVLMSVVLIVAMVLWARQAAMLKAEYVWMTEANGSFQTEKMCIVLDAGHGGIKLRQN